MNSPVFTKVGDEHLRREEAVLRAVDFEGIPKVVAYNQVDGQDFLVMQQLPGVPLDQHIGLDRSWNSRQLPLEETLRIVDGVAACFEALHQVGYLYRDLNLGHVIVSDSGIGLVDHEWDVKVASAGHACVDSMAGTWETMAPEEFAVGDVMHLSSNTYTLGVVLLQLATGRNPFHVSPEKIADSSAQRQQAGQLHKQLPMIDSGHRGVDQMLEQALAPEMSARYQSVTEFRRSLQALALA